MFNAQENSWFTMIALIVCRPEAHLREVQSFKAVLFFFHTDKTRRKRKPFCIFFLLGGQKERPRSQRPPIETVHCGEPTSRATTAGDESTCRSLPLVGEVCACGGGVGVEGVGAVGGDSHAPAPMTGTGLPYRETPTPYANAGSRHSVKCPCDHCPVELLNIFNVSEYLIWFKRCVRVFCPA